MRVKPGGLLSGVSVLLVDDHADTREIVGTYLRYSGSHVELAENGREALDRLTQLRVDVSVIDYTMPGMLGTELLQEIRKLDTEMHRPTPAILYTAYADLRAKALEAGFSATSASRSTPCPGRRSRAANATGRALKASRG